MPVAATKPSKPVLSSVANLTVALMVLIVVMVVASFALGVVDWVCN
jgi:hypothetical protein